MTDNFTSGEIIQLAPEGNQQGGGGGNHGDGGRRPRKRRRGGGGNQGERSGQGQSQKQAQGQGSDQGRQQGLGPRQAGQQGQSGQGRPQQHRQSSGQPQQRSHNPQRPDGPRAGRQGAPNHNESNNRNERSNRNDRGPRHDRSNGAPQHRQGPRNNQPGQNKNTPKFTGKPEVSVAIDTRMKPEPANLKPTQFHHVKKRYGVVFYETLAAAKADMDAIKQKLVEVEQLNIVLRAEGGMDDPELGSLGPVKVFAGVAWALIHDRRVEEGWYNEPR